MSERDPRVPRIDMGNGAWPRLCDAMMLASEPVGSPFGGVECKASRIVPDNMAVLFDARGEITIIDLRTDDEKAASLAPQPENVSGKDPTP